MRSAVSVSESAEPLGYVNMCLVRCQSIEDHKLYEIWQLCVLHSKDHYVANRTFALIIKRREYALKSIFTVS